MADAVVSLGLNAAPFEAGLQRAEKSAKGFAGKLGSLAFGGVGGVAGIGALIGVGIAQSAIRAKNEIDELIGSVRELTSFKGGGLFRDAGGIDQSISAISQRIKELIELQNPTTMSGIVRKEFAKDPLNPGGLDVRINQELAALKEAQSKELGAQLEKQQSITAIANEALSGDERRVEILKAQAAMRERLGKIDEQYGSLGQSGQVNALKDEAGAQFQTELQAINQRHNLKQAELEMEIRLGMFRAKGVDDDVMMVEAARERLSLIDRQLRVQYLTNQQRDALSVQRNDAIGSGRAAQERIRRRMGNARDTFESGRDKIVSGLADELSASPDERRSERAATRRRSRMEATARAQMDDAANRASRGAYNQGDSASKANSEVTTLEKALAEATKELVKLNNRMDE